jgi:glycosyltransferase involved in cell wall biosynthesis
MKLAIVGTRGVPANYGGFETFAEELSSRLADRGHDVTVYCRSHYTPRGSGPHKGVRLVVLPSIRTKHLDTAAHTLLSVAHALFQRFDAILLCNVANAIFLPLARLGRARVAVNVDGLEWRRKKWGRLSKAYLRLAESLCHRWCDALVTDAVAVQTYYQLRYGGRPLYIPYGAPAEKEPSTEVLERFRLTPGRYVLYVSRFEPENNAQLVVQAYGRLDTSYPLVMVGDAPYAALYKRELQRCADPRVLFPGAIYGKGYRALMSHAYCYVHATEAGGTHPALIEGMALSDGVLVSDTKVNRHVAGDSALYFSLSQPEDLARQLRLALTEPDRMMAMAARARKRVASAYSWEKVTDAYEELVTRLSEAGQLAEVACPQWTEETTER